MEKDLKEIELQEIENQLSCPNGEKGIEMGEMMNESNFGMTLSSIELLDIKDQNVILELGHGNCGHLGILLEKADKVSYWGFEISETMCQEARRKNKELISDSQCDFKLYDGENIPFPNNSFDRAMTVNTIYFWTKPVELLNEINRVLKPNGIFVLTFAQKDFMEQLPFIRQKFKLYNTKDVLALIQASNAELVEIVDRTEQVKSKSGNLVERKYTMVKLTKR